MPILAKRYHHLRWSSFWSWRVCKQVKLSHLGHRKHARIIEKPTHPIRVTVWRWFWCKGIIGPFFLENEQGEGVTINGDFYRAMLNELLFTKFEEEDIGNRTALGATQAKLRSMFCSLFLKIALSASELIVVWPPRSCDLTPLYYYLWGVVKDKCYTDKPEKIDAFKDNNLKPLV